MSASRASARLHVTTNYTQEFSITVRTSSPTPTLNISTSALDFSTAAGSQSFNVTSNVTGWTVAVDQTWATVAPTTGNNNGTVTVTANTAATSRTATITVSGSGVTSRTVMVSQAGTSATATAPAITTQPVDKSIAWSGSPVSATFSVVAYGGASYFDIGTLSKTNLAVGETATFTVRPKSGLANGSYNYVSIYISGPTISGKYVNIDFTVTGSATYSITASPASLDFGVLIEGYTTPPAAKTVTITNTGTANVTINPPALSSGGDCCLAWNSTEIATSNTATLTVNCPPVIIEQPKNVTVRVGDPISFTCKLDYFNPSITSLVWEESYNNGVDFRASTGAIENIVDPVSGQYTSTLSPYSHAILAIDGYAYRCKITNATGTTYSNLVWLAVKP